MRIESMRTYFWAAGHEVDAVSFALAMLASTKASVARQIATVGIVPATARAILEVELGDPGDPAGGPRAARAYVNAGSWLWKCECGGAEFVDLERPVGMCAGCWNSADGHRWRRIALPAERERIERLLLARPRANQHWHPGESLADLARENRGHGLRDDGLGDEE